MSGKRIPPTLQGSRGPIAYDLYRDVVKLNGKLKGSFNIMRCFHKEQAYAICEAEKGFQPHKDAVLVYYINEMSANSPLPRNRTYSLF